MRRAALLLIPLSLAIPALALAATQFPTRFSKLELKGNSEKLVFSGTLASGEEKCIKGRKAKLLRKHNGKTKTLGSDESDKGGDFKIKVTDPPTEGKFYGVIKQKTIGSGDSKIVCLERETGSISITISTS